MVTKKRFLIFMLLIFSSCHSQTSIKIVNDACEPPCWQNIIPGSSSTEQTLQNLQRLSGIEPSSIEVRDQPYKIFNKIIYTAVSDEQKISIFLIDDTVASIEFSGDFQISFGEAVEQFGEPQFIIITKTLGPGGLWASSIHTYVSIVYPEKGIMFEYDEYDQPRSLKSKINPEIKLNKVAFFNPNQFEILADSGFILSGSNLEQTQMAMQPWQGYGDIDAVYQLTRP